MIENFCLFPDNILCISVQKHYVFQRNNVNTVSNYSKSILSEITVWFYYVATLCLSYFSKIHNNFFLLKFKVHS